MVSRTCLGHTVHEWSGGLTPELVFFEIFVVVFEVDKAGFTVLFTLPSYFGGKIYIKFTILSIHICGIIYINVQPSPPSISRTFHLPQLKLCIHSLSPQPLVTTILLSFSMNVTRNLIQVESKNLI